MLGTSPLFSRLFTSSTNDMFLICCWGGGVRASEQAGGQ